MPQGHRPDRLGDQIRTETSDILAREVHDPGVGFVTITRVSVTADLQIARVYYTTMATGAERRTPAGRSSAPRRSCAGSSLARGCAVTWIEFRRRSIEQHARIEQLIHEIHEQDAARGADVGLTRPARLTRPERKRRSTRRPGRRQGPARTMTPVETDPEPAARICEALPATRGASSTSTRAAPACRRLVTRSGVGAQELGTNARVVHRDHPLSSSRFPRHRRRR
jgi:ribosome-binding factor A